MSDMHLTNRQPIVISGPSGVGKGTLIQKLKDAHPHTFTSTVSHTTRQQRPGEAEGKDYYFVSSASFSALLSEDAFVEHASFSGHQYGTSRKTITDQTAQGLVVILDIEMNGVRQMRAKTDVEARFVFIRPPSFDALEARLRSRGTEGEEAIERRLAIARAEMDFAETSGAHDKIITNDDLAKAFAELERFVFREG